MTKVKIDPGVCGLITKVTAESEDGMNVHVRIVSACEDVRKMYEALGPDHDAYEVCLSKPGKNAFYNYASQHFPGHAACPVVAGIIKCIEAECRLALPRDVTIRFVTDEN